MADYYPLIIRGVAGLEKSTGEARRALYERARTALVGQLRNMNPPLTESEITRERLALEEAIRKVEAEAARKIRTDPIPEPPAPPKAPEAPPPEDKARAAPVADKARVAPATPALPAQPPPPPSTPTPRRERSPEPASAATSQREPASGEPPPSRTGRSRSVTERMADKGLRGFRDVVAETETLGEKTAQTSRSARAAYAAVPSNIPDLDRIEPRVEPEGLRTQSRELPPQPSYRSPEARPSQRMAEPPPRQEALPDPRAQQRPPGRRAAPNVETLGPPPRSRKGLVAALLTLFIIFALAVMAYIMRDRIPGWLGAVRQLAPAATTDQTPARPKIPDRVGQVGPPATKGPGQTGPGQGPGVAAVAQRVVLYEEDPADPAGKRYVGSAIWRTETVSPGPGQPPELVVRCDVEIPERRMGMTLSLRRNNDTALPASHTIEILFNLPADFQFGGINNVPGILMKQAEQTRGAPLAGLAVKVTSGFFLVGLSAVENEMQRNLQLLKERGWFDIPVVYNNGRRAILAVEKGTPGEKAFSEAFAAWKQ